LALLKSRVRYSFNSDWPAKSSGQNDLKKKSEMMILPSSFCLAVLATRILSRIRVAFGPWILEFGILLWPLYA